MAGQLQVQPIKGLHRDEVQAQGGRLGELAAGGAKRRSPGLLHLMVATSEIRPCWRSSWWARFGATCRLYSVLRITLDRIGSASVRRCGSSRSQSLPSPTIQR